MPFRFPTTDPSLLLIVSGPAGSGKTTLCERLVASEPSVRRAITCTTRAPRTAEVDGQDYYFLSEEEFERSVESGEFLEYAGVHGARYGTLKREIHEKLARSQSVALNIDVQGAATIRGLAEQDPVVRGRMVSVFVLPPNLDVLRERLRARGTEDDGAIERRLRRAEEEMRHWVEYDYCIRSGSKSEDFQQLQSIWRAELRRVPRLLNAGS